MSFDNGSYRLYRAKPPEATNREKQFFRCVAWWTSALRAMARNYELVSPLMNPRIKYPPNWLRHHKLGNDKHIINHNIISITHVCVYNVYIFVSNHIFYLAGLSGSARWIMPMTNAHGYALRRREENSMDPNRDFPYLQRPEKCMRTQTARAVNDTWSTIVTNM